MRLTRRPDQQFQYRPQPRIVVPPPAPKKRPWTASIAIAALIAFVGGLAKLVVDADKINDVACKYRTDELGNRPAHCPPPPLPKNFDKGTIDDVRATRATAERLERKLDVVSNERQAPRLSLEHAFHVTPLSFSSDLTVSVRKVSTDVGGYFRLFICRRNSETMRRVGESAYAAGSDDFSFAETFASNQAIILLNVEPRGKDPVTIISVWDLSKNVRINEPVSRAGLLACGDIKGQF
ncbi:MAG: hypothetical protein ABL901_03795 [Hyphomicrobiaceae bacterium]